MTTGLAGSPGDSPADMALFVAGMAAVDRAAAANSLAVVDRAAVGCIPVDTAADNHPVPAPVGHSSVGPVPNRSA